ncbi:MAG: His/Gly/Thr/Pro-type tRNA ligase C-terminal domain-containing protein [Candidatus Gracilibacteria bacterium]
MYERIEETEESEIITTDLFPEDHKYLTFLKKVFRHEFRKNGFRRISTDILEDGKFRENAEIGIMNAYLSHHCNEQIQPIYYYYMDHFLNDDEQEERIGGEVIGENDPILDAISVYLNYISLNKIGLENTFVITINSVGIEKEKIKYKEELQNFYANKKHMLSDESLKLLETNPMLLLGLENEDEKILATQAPSMIKFLKKDSKAHYLKFKEYLDLLQIPYIEDHTLISKNDYNTNTVWQIKSETGKTIGNGARYNTLAKTLGNPKDITATGFHINTSVVIEMLKNRDIKILNKDQIDLFFVQLGDEAKMSILPLSIEAREAGINTVVSLGTPSMKEQMLKANRSGAKYVVMVGIMEARSGVYQVRNIEAGTQEEVKKEELIEYIIGKIGKEKLDFYCPAKDLIKE